MQDLFQLRVRDAKLPAPDSRHTCNGGVLERVAQGASTDHACGAHDGNTCLAHRRNVHSRPEALVAAFMPLILKNLSDVRGDKVYFRNPMDLPGDGKVIDRSCIALCSVVNQTEMNGNRVFTV